MKSIKNLLAKRGFPPSIEAFKSCTASYSQFGEDMIVASLFPKESPCGYYLDLGCYHPLQWSNTYHFYRRGWRGLSVDASGAFKRHWHKHRPRDTHLVCAVTPSPLHQVLNYVESRDLPATNYCQIVNTSQSEVPQQNRDEKLEIQSLAISELSQWWPFAAQPTIVSSDLEGLDYEIWKNFPFECFKPKVLILENHDNSMYKALSDHLCDNGYELYGLCGPSLVYRLL